MSRRSLAELIDAKDPGWPVVQGWIARAKNQLEVLPPAATRADTLIGLQVTTRSTMGAVAYETGGMLVDHGWVRLLGSGHPRLPRDVVGWNRDRGVPLDHGAPPFLLIADDVVGGLFALDGDRWGTDHHVYYFAPDTLRWEDTGKGYSDFVAWLFEGDLDTYYADYRWDGWQRDVEAAPGDRAYSIVPFPFTQDAPIPRRSRRLIPVAELYGLYQDLARQLEDVPDGTPIELEIRTPPTKP